MTTNTDEDNMIEDNDGDETTCLIQSADAAGDKTLTATDSGPIDEDMLARTVDVVELVEYAKGFIAEKISLERELRAQNDEVLSYRRDLYKTMDELAQNEQFVQDELNQKQEVFDNEFAVLESERRQFQDRNEMLENAAVEHDRTVQSLKAALDEANRQCETLFTEVNALRRQDRKLGLAEKAKDVLREQYDQLKKDFDELTATGDDYEWKMAQSRMEIDILTESKAALEEQLAKVTEEVKMLRTSEEQLREERARNIKLQAKVTDLERKRDADDEMERKVNELENRNNAQLDGDRLAKELDQEKVRAAGLEVKLKETYEKRKHQLQEQLRKKMDRAEKEMKLREENRKLNDERKLPAEKGNGPAQQPEGSSKQLRRVVSESDGSPRPLKESAIQNSPAGHLFTSTNKINKKGRRDRLFPDVSSK